MTKDEQKAKYGRIANDPSQLEMFKDDVIDGEVNGLPETPSESYDTPVVLKYKNGELVWEEEGSGPTPPVPPTPPTPSLVVKGDVIVLGNKPYKVLQANADNTDVELISLQGATVLNFYDEYSYEDDVEFETNAGTRYGIKYDGSKVDQYCQTNFIASLPQDVQDAIIEQQVVQDMYDTLQYSEVQEGDFTIDSIDFYRSTSIYRVRKRNTLPVTIGLRKAYIPSFADAYAFFGDQTLAGDFMNVFKIGMAFRDAYFSDSHSEHVLSPTFQSTVYLSSMAYSDYRYVCPAFHVDLTQVER